MREALIDLDRGRSTHVDARGDLSRLRRSPCSRRLKHQRDTIGMKHYANRLPIRVDDLPRNGSVEWKHLGDLGEEDLEVLHGREDISDSGEPSRSSLSLADLDEESFLLPLFGGGRLALRHLRLSRDSPRDSLIALSFSRPSRAGIPSSPIP